MDSTAHHSPHQHPHYYNEDSAVKTGHTHNEAPSHGLGNTRERGFSERKDLPS